MYWPFGHPFCEVLVKAFCPCLIELVILFSLSYRSSLYVLDTDLLGLLSDFLQGVFLNKISHFS